MLIEILKDLYASEINISISCFWDGGWNIALGDLINGWGAKVMLDDLENAPEWIIENATRIWPKSDFTALYLTKAANLLGK